MEKLIELLNEYWNDYYWHNYKRYFVPNHICWEWCDNSECSELLIISEKYWFIKWLVENNKIRKDIYRPIPFKIKIEYEDGVRYIEKLEDRILMELSIQDNPIEFLIGILK